jgi:hypothetical protein
MNRLLTLTLLALLFTNCHLSDLEDYKHLEDHSEDYLELISQPSYYQDYDTLIHDLFNVNAHFTIDRRIHYSFFLGMDTTIEAPQIRIIGENGKNYAQGEYSFQSWYSYDPEICSRYFTIRVLAISDIDTIKTTVSLQNKHYFHCKKGGVDSIPVNIKFGDDSTSLSYINPMGFLSFSDIANIQNPIIITRFSRTYNKAYITLFNDIPRIDAVYNFIKPSKIDSLLLQTTLTTSFFFECNIRGNIDREALCNIWEKRLSFNLSSSICEILQGNQYALVCPLENYNDYLVFLLRINKITSDNSLAGNAECMLYMLN